MPELTDARDRLQKTSQNAWNLKMDVLQKKDHIRLHFCKRKTFRRRYGITETGQIGKAENVLPGLFGCGAQCRLLSYHYCRPQCLTHDILFRANFNCVLVTLRHTRTHTHHFSIKLSVALCLNVLMQYKERCGKSILRPTRI